jgi:hypothetical protein
MNIFVQSLFERLKLTITLLRLQNIGFEKLFVKFKYSLQSLQSLVLPVPIDSKIWVIVSLEGGSP